MARAHRQGNRVPSDFGWIAGKLHREWQVRLPAMAAVATTLIAVIVACSAVSPDGRHGPNRDDNCLRATHFFS